MTSRSHEALVRRDDELYVAAVPTKVPEPGGLLVAPTYVGVCGTDLQILNRTRPDTAEILGHEGAGIVVEAGVGAPLREGQHVVFNPSAQLPAGRILGHNVPGLFQRYFSVDSQGLRDGLVLPAEDGLPPICGALVEPLGGIIYAHDLVSRVVSDLRSVVVFGAGPIGLLTAEYLKQQEARVLLIHPSQKRLNTAIGLGLMDATSVMTFSRDVSEQILDWNHGSRLDAAVICTSMQGASAALRHASEVLKNGACIEMVTNYPEWSPAPEGISTAAIRAVRAANVCGMPPAGEYVTAEISGRSLIFTGHRGTSRGHLIRSMAALSSRPTKYASFITHVLGLHDAAMVITSLSQSRSTSISGTDCVKAVVDLMH